MNYTVTDDDGMPSAAVDMDKITDAGTKLAFRLSAVRDDAARMAIAAMRASNNLGDRSAYRRQPEHGRGRLYREFDQVGAERHPRPTRHYARECAAPIVQRIPSRM